MAARLLFDLNFGRRHKKQRVYRHFSHNFDEAEYKERYRFSMESVRFITDLIEPELYRPTLRSHSLSAINQVEIALRYFATGRFTNRVAKWPGSNHDSFIFRGSNVGTDLEVHHRGIDVDGVLLGDSGYACGRYLVTPFLRPVNQAQQNYNAAHTRTRACKPERVSKIIVACAVLHNIALDRKETMAEDDNGIACDEEDLGGVAVQPRNDNIRQFIVDNYF
uniref:DDE Tnp4 domain-containing protein n=1 Tax=Magallana gigas TaxID=29159 RepID=A0A8W8NWR8_MAGGI